MANHDQEYFRPLWDGFDGELFQDLVCDLLIAEGYKVEPSGVGPDGAVDAFAKQSIVFGYNHPEDFVWAVQCKYTSKLGKAISPSDVGSIHNSLNNERFEAKNIQGFFLATNGRLSTNMMSELRGLNNSRTAGIKTTYWDRSKIHDVLERNYAVYKKYFTDPPRGGGLPPGDSPSGSGEQPSRGTDALAEFERLINSPNTREVEILAFLEKHPSFLALGEGTASTIIPQLTIDAPGIGSLRPDFIIRSGAGPYIDVVEIERPTTRLLIRRGGRTVRSHAWTQAVGQLRFYRDAMESPDVQERLSETFGGGGVQPRLMLIIGRSADFSGELERVKLQSQEPDVTVITYDDLMEYARKRITLDKTE